MTRQEINSNKRRQRLIAAKRLGTHTKKQWIELCEEFEYRCVRCGLQGVHIEKDHIIPIYQKGSDSIENIQPFCAWCNAKKGPDTFNWKIFRRENGFEKGKVV